MRPALLQIALALLGLLVSSGTAAAHSQSYAYLNLARETAAIAGRLDVAVRDLDRLHGLDGDGNGSVTWGEFRRREQEIAAATLGHVGVTSAGTPCALALQPALLTDHGGDSYVVLPFTARDCPPDGSLALTYDLLGGIDAQHRAIVTVTEGGDTQTTVVAPRSSSMELSRAAGGLIGSLAAFVVHGIHHILIGYDHILFVITLLLGTAMQRREASARAVFLGTAKVVTAFTLSHSVTLGLAATGLLQVPVAVAESLIAATIAIAAVNNLWPVLTRRLWLVALVFGLIHGVGFANVLADVGLPQQNLLASLIAFNVGVELGQLAVVAVALPLLLMLRARGFGCAVAPAANVAITVVGLMWFSDRVFGTALMPF